MKDAFGYGSFLVCLLLLGTCLLQFGNHWTVGRYFMPRSIVDESGMRYSDGSQIDGITLACIKADVEEEVFLVLILVASFLPAWVAFDKYRIRRKDAKIVELGPV